MTKKVRLALMAELQAATNSVHKELRAASRVGALDPRSRWVRLQILVEELSRAAPARKAEHDKLLRGSAEFLASRRKDLSEEQQKRLDEDLERALRVESAARPEQLARLRSWLTGPPHLPLAGIDAPEAGGGDAPAANGETMETSESRYFATDSMVRSTG